MSESTVIVALITALSAIFSPIISTYITHIVQARNKKAEILYEQKLNIFKDFTIKSMLYINQYISNNYSDDLSSDIKKDFLTSYQTAFLICNKTTRNILNDIELYDDIYNGNRKLYAEFFLNTIKAANMAMNEELSEQKELSNIKLFKKFKKNS